MSYYQIILDGIAVFAVTSNPQECPTPKQCGFCSCVVSHEQYEHKPIKDQEYADFPFMRNPACPSHSGWGYRDKDR